jgi:peptide/nickel transport system ATP-binding protein
VSGRSPVVLEAQSVGKDFTVGTGWQAGGRRLLRAVDDVSFILRRGETVGLVGESGSGKTTVARMVAQTLAPTRGTVLLDGEDVAQITGQRRRRAARRRVQMIFQDPYSSFDRRATIEDSLQEPLIVHERSSRRDRHDRVVDLVERVGLSPDHLARYPAELSGGQLQRLAIARALTVLPEVIVCDEPVSSLDVSIQAQVVNLLIDLQREFGVAYLFIAHDLSVVRHVSHRIAVMYLGRIVEAGDVETVGERPRHPYTQALLSAVPYPDPAVQRARRRIVLGGEIPSPLAPPQGCHFAPRCPYAMAMCRDVAPPPFTTPDGTVVTCHLHEHGPALAGRPLEHLGAV